MSNNSNSIDTLKKLDEKYGAYYKPNSIIFNEGDRADKFYILRKGIVKIVKESNDVQITINTIEQGEVFGEMGLITSNPRNASAISLTECYIISLTEKMFKTLIKNNKSFLYFLLKAFGNKIRYLSNMVSDLTSGNDFIIITTYFVNYLNTLDRQINIELNINDVLRHISVESNIPFEVALKVLKELEEKDLFKIKRDIIYIKNKDEMIKDIPRYF